MWYDVLCLIILVLSIWRGMVKGLVWQLATIAGLVICFFFAEAVSASVAPHIGIEPPLSRWVAIFGLYVVGSFAAFSLARLIKGSLEKAKFADYDRHLGAIFGFIKGATICLTLSFFLFTLSENTRETVMHSTAGYASAVTLSAIQPVLPHELDDILTPYLAGFEPEAIEKHRKEHPESNLYNEYNHDQSEHDATSRNETPFKEMGEETNIKSLVDKIPGLFGQDLQQIVYEAFEKTEAKDHPELLKKLSSGVPGLIRQVASEWKQGKPESQLEANSENWRQRRAKLLREIAGVYARSLEAQESVMEEVVAELYGVPDAVTVSVLEDWHADLMN
ncbi:MAG: CvpA family protein, partial [Planctomycetaceae bacterium]|nr:CvpA family protein [Planctomycetaceae bacterium]